MKSQLTASLLLLLTARASALRAGATPLLRPAPALCRRAAPAPHMSDVIPPWIEPSVTSAAVFGIANTLGFGISVATGSHLHLDLIGTGVFAASALVLRGATRSQNLSAAAIALWSAKLASFLFYRVLQTKHDARLGDMLSTVSGAATFWVASFLWGWLVSLPHTLAAGVPVAARPAGVPLLAKFGALMFAAGFAVETVADLQKWAFKNDAANAGKCCSVGLWKMSQHPNWAGNLLLWSGILVINAPTLLAAVRRAARRARRPPARSHATAPPPPPPPRARARLTAAAAAARDRRRRGSSVGWRGSASRCWARSSWGRSSTGRAAARCRTPSSSPARSTRTTAATQPTWRRRRSSCPRSNRSPPRCRNPYPGTNDRRATPIIL